ncbi:hypothetical protein N9J24_00575 [Bacteroidia bacterium]|nr:hypothetical protein [Bacteroidia bacterium]
MKGIVIFIGLFAFFYLGHSQTMTTDTKRNLGEELPETAKLKSRPTEVQEYGGNISLNLFDHSLSINGAEMLYLGARGIDALARTNASILTANGSISIKGSRANASGIYIDGMRVGNTGNMSLMNLSLAYE